MKSSSQIPRIRSYLESLERQVNDRDTRLMLWRLIIDCAHRGHEAEVSELESLSVPLADPAILSLTGEPVV